jgi:hypothetical protein
VHQVVCCSLGQHLSYLHHSRAFATLAARGAMHALGRTLAARSACLVMSYARLMAPLISPPQPCFRHSGSTRCHACPRPHARCTLRLPRHVLRAADGRHGRIVHPLRPQRTACQLHGFASLLDGHQHASPLTALLLISNHHRDGQLQTMVHA